LPLSGGTLTGDLTVDGHKLWLKGGKTPSSIYNYDGAADRTVLRLVAGGDHVSSGAMISMYGGDDAVDPHTVRFHTNNQKTFELNADQSARLYGQAKAINGTAAKPAYSFDGDPDTGLYWNSNNNLAFTAGGKRIFRIDKDQGAKVFGDLQVDGTITTGAGKQIFVGGNWDNALIANTTASGREYMNFGESAGGGARLRLYGPGDSSYPGNAYIYGGGAIVARFNKDRDTKLYGGLQVDGQTKAQNGTKTAPAYSFTSDPKTGLYLYSKGIASITCDGKNVANFGLAGVSFPEGLATITGTAANMHIGSDGQLRRITDVRAPSIAAADLARLESIIETLTARIEALEK